MRSRKAVITGGTGFLGLRLCQKLREEGWSEVLLFDVHHPRNLLLPDGVRVVAGDLRVASDVSTAIQDADCVFHAGSFGMSGIENRQTHTIQHVNIEGTQNVIDACKDHGVPRLVYVSTYNVAFDGNQPQPGMKEETCSYVTGATCHDQYSLTKSVAERLVLASNTHPPCPPSSSSPSHQGKEGVGGRVKEGGGEEEAVKQEELFKGLCTCSVRPAGLWGTGERRHMSRVCEMARQGMLLFTIGDRESKVDWVHVDNLCMALLLAAKHLTPQTSGRARGQAYFISDGAPINNFEFFKPFVTGLGYSWPRLALPLHVALGLAWCMELGANVCEQLLGRDFTPMLNRMEVQKCAVTHWADISKARQDLGYSPIQHSPDAAIAWYKANGFAPPKKHEHELALIMVRRMKALFAIAVLLIVLTSWGVQQRKLARQLAGSDEL